MDDQAEGFQPTRKALHVLVVDDNRDAADSLCMLLRLWGYECLVAYDGAAGLQAACDYLPDCLLLDIAMPGLDGYTLARTVRAQPSLVRAKLVALTAYSDETHVRRSQEAGFHFHLVKPTEPLEIERLMNMLNELIRLASGAEELARQNVALASETKELLKEVKEDIEEVKEEVKELKDCQGGYKGDQGRCERLERGTPRGQRGESRRASREWQLCRAGIAGCGLGCGQARQIPLGSPVVKQTTHAHIFISISQIEKV